MTTAVFVLTLWIFGQPSLQLPVAAKKELDQKFPGWKLLEYSKEFYGDQPVDGESKPFLKCQLNYDTRPDYVLGITVRKATSLIVYFVALVSKRESFSVFVLASYPNPEPNQNPLSVCLYLYPKNVPVTNFGFDDEENVPEGLLQKWDRNELIFTFDRDCPALVGTDKNGCRTFVFEKEKFWTFEACD